MSKSFIHFRVSLNCLLIGMLYVTGCTSQSTAVSQVDSTAIAPTSTHEPVQITHTRTPDPSPIAQSASDTPAAQVVPTDLAYDWLQFNGDPQHSGNNTLETRISPDNAAGLQQLFQVSLPAVADGAPVYLHAVQTPQGTKDVVFVTTLEGHIVALDAATGAQVWVQQYGANGCRINLGSNACYTTSSPAIDPNHKYIYSYGLYGFVHKYQVGDGQEIKGGGWPELTTTKPFNEKGSSSLSIATASTGTSYLYATNSGYYGDRGDYQGHVTTIDLANGKQRVFNSLCSDQTVHFAQRPAAPDCANVQSGIWSRASVIYDSDTHKIYMATGNGHYDPNLHDWGDTVFALNPDGSGPNGNPLDSYTPDNFSQLDVTDQDLGTTTVVILPASPATPAGGVRHLGLQSGKDGLLRLLDLDNLSGQGGPGHTGGEVGQVVPLPQGDGVFTQPGVWVNPADHKTWVFIASASGISGLNVTIDGTGTPQLESQWTDPAGGTSPVIANGVLFYASYDGISALDPLTGNPQWSDPQVANFHWESPIVANGVLYITDGNGRLTAYSINGKLYAGTQ
jgi:outer membrane protein assembly factor BamB